MHINMHASAFVYVRLCESEFVTLRVCMCVSVFVCECVRTCACVSGEGVSNAKSKGLVAQVPLQVYTGPPQLR